MSHWLHSRRVGHLLGFLVCAGLLGYALYLEHVDGLEPCPLCMFQRLVILAMGAAFLAAALHGPRRKGAWIYSTVQMALGALGLGIALRHLWIQSLPPDQVPACGMGIGYMFETLPLLEVISRTLKGTGECAHVDLVLGLSIPAWALILFVVLMAWAVLLAVKNRH
jgi:disulfide bond formation protein DsbB